MHASMLAAACEIIDDSPGFRQSTRTSLHSGCAMVTATEVSAERPRSSDARVIGLVSAAHFVSHIYILLLPPLFAFIRRDYGLSYQELGIVLASFNIVSAALQTPAG